MLMFAIGLLFILLGLFSGATLVLAPLGLISWSGGVTLWAIFPAFSIAGYVAFVIGARSTQIRGVSIAISALLLLLAAIAAVGIVLISAAVIPANGDTLALWYVLGVAGILGIVGAASHQKATEP